MKRECMLLYTVVSEELNSVETTTAPRTTAIE